MNADDIEALADEAKTLSKAIHPLLAGRPPWLQGVVIGDLLAIWLCEHYVEGDREATAAAREKLLDKQVRYVRDVVQLLADDAEAWRKANGEDRP